MAIEDVSGIWKGACPWCGSDVSYWYYGSDCRGNPPSGGAICEKRCGFLLKECPRNVEEILKVAPPRPKTWHDHINEDDD